MADKTGIQWTQATWNPVTGCTKVSPGCKHCYAEKMAERLLAMGQDRYRNGFELTLQPDALDQPLRWKRPRVIFVNSMSDLFHDGVPEDYIARVFDVMVRAHQHTFQVLTKRAQRLAELAPRLPWPANVWMGVSVENQKHGMPRALDLLSVPAAVRFLSVEPLLEGIDLKLALDYSGRDFVSVVNVLTGTHGTKAGSWTGNKIGWVIVGGESGVGARPMAVEWAAAVVRDCQAADVPVFVKQLGSVWARENGASHRKGGDPAEWPEHLRVREMPVRRSA